MQFDGFDQSGLEVTEIRTVEIDKATKFQMLHEGFKSKFVDEQKNYLGLNTIAKIHEDTNPKPFPNIILI